MKARNENGWVQIDGISMGEEKKMKTKIREKEKGRSKKQRSIVPL